MVREDNKKRVYLTLLSFAFFLFIFSFTSATVPTIKQNQTIQLTAVCDNCSFVNLTKVENINGIILLGQYPMTQNGTNYIYNFTNTYTLGTYKYVTCGDLNGVLTCDDSADRTFTVTPTGDSNLTTFLFIILAVIVLTFILGVSLESNWLVFFGFLEILFFGIWVIVSGIDVIKNTGITWAIGLILWGVAITGMFRSAQGMLEEGFGK